MQATLIQPADMGSRCNLRSLGQRLNRVQSQIKFEFVDSEFNLGEPSGIKSVSEPVNYTVADLRAAITKSEIVDNADTIICVIDHELIDEYFSFISYDNQVIFVSTRLAILDGALVISNKGIEEYVMLEIGAQLIALLVRRALDIHVLENECAPPWHLARRHCVFDFHGLGPGDGEKLMQPRLCGGCEDYVRSADVSSDLVNASLAIIQDAARLQLMHVFGVSGTRGDPILVLLVGVLGGATLGALIGATGLSGVALGLLALLLMGRLMWLNFESRTTSRPLE